MNAKFGNVLVTGGAGFIGSQLLRRLLPISKRVIVIDDLSTGQYSAVPDSDRLTFIEQSYVDETLLDRVLPEIDHIFHLACRNLVMSAQNTDVDFHVNLYGGYLLLKKAKEACRHLKRFIYTSTASVYGNAPVLPTSEAFYQTTLPYAASKFSMEHYCQVYHSMYGMPIATLRLSNVYGPGQLKSNPYCGVVAKFFEAIEAGNPFIVYGDGLQTRDYTYIDDAIDALIIAGIHDHAIGQVFNVGTGIETNVIRLAELVARAAGRSIHPIEQRPKRTVDVVTRRCLNAWALRHTLGWQPNTTLEQGLLKTYRWLQRGGEA